MYREQCLTLYWKSYRYILNLIGRVLHLFGLFDLVCNFLWPLNEQSLTAAAQRVSNYSDFGTHFQQHCTEPFHLLVQSWKDDNRVSLLGRKLLYYNYVGLLSNILHVNKAFNEISRLKQVQIKQPIFIIGWPRTGSTILHNLLAQDSALRAPLLWELVSPCPPPHPDTRQTDPRIKETADSMRMWFAMEPEMKKIHYLQADRPDECCHPFEQTFIDRHFPVIGQNTNRYTEWLFSRSDTQMAEYYQQYKRILQIISLNDAPGKRFVLKDSTHLMFIPSLLQVFPDARIIITHREPVEVVGSCCSGFYILSHFYYHHNGIERKKLGQRVLMYLSECVRRLMQTRQKMNEPDEKKIFFDMNYKIFIKDPVATVKDIYNHFDMPFTSQLETKMKQFLADNQKDKHGRHTYSLQPFDITTAQLDSLFGDYCAKYGVTK